MIVLLHSIQCLMLIRIVSSINATDSTFTFDGNSNKQTEFQSIFPKLDGTCNLESISLSYVSIKREFILDALDKCWKLKTLKLVNITWDSNNNGNSARKVYLPLLEFFQLHFLDDKKNHIKTEKNFESLIFFHKNHSRVNGLQDLQNVQFSIAVNFSEGGYILLTNTNLHIYKLKNINIWPSFQSLWSQFQTIRIEGTDVNVNEVDFSHAEELTLIHNKIKNGRMADLIRRMKNVKVLDLSVLDDEAIDVSLFSCESLVEITTWKISLRWSSKGMLLFQNLTKLNITYGDVNLRLFSVSTKFQILSLDHVFLVDSNFEDIKVQMPNLTQLYISYLGFRGPAPELDVSLLPLRLSALILTNIKLQNTNPSFSFESSLTSLLLVRCKLANNRIVKEFNNIFKYLENIGVTMNILNPLFMKAIFQTPMTNFIVMISDRVDEEQLSNFNRSMQILAAISLKKDIRGVIIQFQKSDNGWIEVNKMKNTLLEQFSRIFKLLMSIGLRKETISYGVLNIIFYTYLTLVYSITTIGIVCNSLSAVVLVQKSMKSSTSFIMLALTVCDLLFLVTMLFVVEEFKLLFEYEDTRNAFVGYFAYPLNQTAYIGAVYITILITIERFVAISFPFQSSSIFTTRKTVKYITLLLVFAIVFNIPRWFEYVQWPYEISSPDWSSNFPRQLHRFSSYKNIYQRGFTYFFVYVVPLLMIAILNSLIAMKVRRAIERRRILATSTAPTTTEKSLTKLLLLIVLIFFICNSLSAIINWILISKEVEPEMAEIFASLPIIINSSVNFILYYLMGTKFRAELIELLNKIWRKLPWWVGSANEFGESTRNDSNTVGPSFSSKQGGANIDKEKQNTGL